MSDHTPGPWIGSYKYSRDFGDGTVTTADNKHTIACVFGPNWGEYRDAEDGGEAEFEANARLIAAAPEMKPIVSAVANLFVAPDLGDDTPIFGTNGNYITAGDVRRARAAILKAEGRS